MAYGFDAEQQLVWIDAFEHAVDSRAGVLCRRHADAMVVPLGWMLDDRREAAPRLFVPGEPVVAPAVQRERRRAPAATATMTQLQLDGDDEAHGSDVVEPSVAADEQPAAPWKPVFDQTDDLDGLLGASSPLLSRAFNGRTRRR
jgi:hypothetical protein